MSATALQSLSDYVSRMGRDTGWSAYPAVTLAVTKVDSSNVTVVTREARRALDKLAKDLLPATIRMSVTRDLGEKAEHTLSEVNKHMLITIVICHLTDRLHPGVACRDHHGRCLARDHHLCSYSI